MGFFVTRSLAFIWIRKSSGIFETHISRTSVHEIGFELILRNVFIFELRLVDDRNKIWFTCLFFALCIKANLTIFNSTAPLEINTVRELNIKILSVIEQRC